MPSGVSKAWQARWKRASGTWRQPLPCGCTSLMQSAHVDATSSFMPSVRATWRAARGFSRRSATAALKAWPWAPNASAGWPCSRPSSTTNALIVERNRLLFRDASARPRRPNDATMVANELSADRSPPGQRRSSGKTPSRSKRITPVNDSTPTPIRATQGGDLQRIGFSARFILRPDLMNTSMTPEQLTGKHARLRQELAEAYSESAWRAGRIDRIADELAQTERRWPRTSRPTNRPKIRCSASASEPPRHAGRIAHAFRRALLIGHRVSF